LDWNPGSDAPLPVSYRVDVSTDGRKWSSRESDTRSITSPNYEHKRLKAGTTYFYRVFPVSGDQIGPASGQGPAPAAVAAITTGVARAPGNVDNVKADSKGRPGQITLTWDAPTFDDGRPNNGGRKITHYLIRYHEEDEEYSTASDVHGNVSAESGVGTEGTTELVLATPDLPDDTKLVDVTMTTWEHKGLDDDTTYRYEIRAINNIARNNVIEALSAPLEAVDNTGPSVKPGAPMYLIAEDAKDSNSDVAGDTGVLLLWSAPADPSGDDVDHYMIERKVMGEDDDKWQVLVRSWPAVKSYYTDPDGPEEGQIYYYRLNASNDVDTSGWSNEYRLPMHDEPHGARTEPMLGAAATDVMATANADGSVTLSWTADPAATHYFVAGIDADTDPDSLVWEFADNLGSHTVTAELDGDALASSETYRFLVIAGRWMESGGTWTGSWGSTWSNVDMATIN
jgi:hypothetical protein